MAKVSRLISNLPVSNPFPFLERPFSLKPIFEEIGKVAASDKFISSTKKAINKK